MGAVLAEIPEIVWWGLGALGIGAAVKDVGEGAQSTSNSLVNVAIAGAVIYFVAKKAKVI